MEVLVPVARTLGYEPDTYVCPDQVPTDRPYPWTCFQNAMAFGIYPLESCVKIGDTVPDIEEGLKACGRSVVVHSPPVGSLQPPEGRPWQSCGLAF